MRRLRAVPAPPTPAGSFELYERGQRLAWRGCTLPDFRDRFGEQLRDAELELHAARITWEAIERAVFGA